MPASQAPSPPEHSLLPFTLLELAFLALSGHCACFWPFTRKQFGVAALGINGLAAMTVMYFYAAMAPCPEIVLFFAVWFVLVAFHRVVTLTRCWQGRELHSRFDGVPWLVQSIVWPKPDELVAKAVCEPLLCLVVAGLLYPASPKLAVFIASGAVSLAVKKGIERGIENAQIRVMRDKEFEMRQRFARYRSQR